MIAELLEVAMLISFGAAWPVSILKSYRVRTAKGKSLMFLLIICFGYMCGIASKFAADRVNYVVAFYCLNLVAVLIDVGLYARNNRLDRLARLAGEKD